MEYKALFEVAQETIWLRTMMVDLRVPIQRLVTNCSDDESSIRLAQNLVSHAKTKHISIHYHFVKEKLESEEMAELYISTTEQVQNIFTIPLEKALFKKFRSSLQVISLVDAST